MNVKYNYVYSNAFTLTSNTSVHTNTQQQLMRGLYRYQTMMPAVAGRWWNLHTIINKGQDRA